MSQQFSRSFKHDHNLDNQHALQKFKGKRSPRTNTKNLDFPTKGIYYGKPHIIRTAISNKSILLSLITHTTILSINKQPTS